MELLGRELSLVLGGFRQCRTEILREPIAPQNPTKQALVTATVSVGGQQVSETFPVAIGK